MVRYLFRVTLLSILFVMLTYPSRSQKLSALDKKYMADSITRVYVWTYIRGDSSFTYYSDVMDQVKSVLAEKGYLATQVFYNSATHLSPSDWKTTLILKLKGNEAFLDLSTEFIVDSSGLIYKGERVVSAVEDNQGVIQAQMNQPVTGIPETGYFSFSEAMLYLPRKTNGSGAQGPAYASSDSAISSNFLSVLRTSLSGIPVSKNPHARQVQPKSMLRMEMFGFWGYSAGSSMDVTKGTARYSPGWNAGGEIAVSMTRSVDIFFLYDREATTIDINSSKRESEENLTFSLNYYLFGVNKNFRVNRILSPFVGLAIGGVNTVPADKFYRDTWYFAMQAQGGCKFYLTRFFGIRVQAALIYQVHPVGAPFLYSMNYTSYPIDADSNPLYFNATGGIFFRIGR